MQPARPLTLLLFTIILNHCNGHLGNKLENQRIRVDAVHVSCHSIQTISIFIEISIAAAIDDHCPQFEWNCALLWRPLRTVAMALASLAIQVKLILSSFELRVING
jgi:hypothetical protein